MALFKKRDKEKAEKKCDLEKCKQNIRTIQVDFKEFLKKLKEESEVESKKNGSWLNSDLHK